MLRARTTELENDVNDMIENSENLGHANPKQKLQYHMRYATHFFSMLKKSQSMSA